MPAEKKGILDIKALKGLIKLLVGLFVVIKVLDIFFSYAISPFITGFVMQYLIFKKLKSVVTLEPKYTTLKARVVVKGSPHVIGKHIFDIFQLESQSQGKASKSPQVEDFEEAFVIVPCKPSKNTSKKSCFIYFISNFSPIGECKVPFVSWLASDDLKLERMSGVLSICL